MRVRNDRMDTYLQVLFDELKRWFIKPILTELEFFNIRIVKQEVQAHFISRCFASLKKNVKVRVLFKSLKSGLLERASRIVCLRKVNRNTCFTIE